MVALLICYGPDALQAQSSATPEQDAAAQQRREQFQQQLELRRELYAPLGQPTGRDLVVLQEHKPFYLKLQSIGQYTSNAFLTENDRDDFFTSHTLEGGLQTRVAETIDVRVGGEVALTRYSEFSELDYDNWGGEFSLSYPIDGFRFGMAYEPTVIEERGFGERELTLHDISAFARYQRPLSESTGIFADVRVARVLADPDDYDSYKASVGTGLFWAPARKWLLLGGANVSYRRYDDYFEEITGDERRDWRLSPFVRLTYSPREWVTAGLQLRFVKNYSTLDPLDYEQYSITPRLSLKFKF